MALSTAASGMHPCWTALRGDGVFRRPSAVTPKVLVGQYVSVGADSLRRMAEPVKGPASYFPSIEEKYGRPISEWQTLIRSSELTGHMELVSWLKSEHGLGHGHANALVAYTLKEDAAG
jgi:hypothetical protein